MEQREKSFFERLTGSISMEEEVDESSQKKLGNGSRNGNKDDKNNWLAEENDEAELAVDLYQTPTEIVIQTMVAGVRPEDLEISITRDMATISGKREESRVIDEENYFAKELYWGKFSRTISLPQEVEPEEVDAVVRHGLLTIKLQKVDKEKKNKVKVKSL